MAIRPNDIEMQETTDKRLYVYEVNGEFQVSRNLSDLAVMGTSRIVGVYESVGSGTLRCDPLLTMDVDTHGVPFVHTVTRQENG